MVSNKELLEADAFDRGRLVSAFVRGSADAERRRHGRALLAGAVLVVLLLAAVLVLPVLGVDVDPLLRVVSG